MTKLRIWQKKSVHYSFHSEWQYSVWYILIKTLITMNAMLHFQRHVVMKLVMAILVTLPCYYLFHNKLKVTYLVVLLYISFTITIIHYKINAGCGIGFVRKKINSYLLVKIVIGPTYNYVTCTVHLVYYIYLTRMIVYAVSHYEILKLVCVT